MTSFEVYRLHQRGCGGNHDVFTLLIVDEDGGYRVSGPEIVPGMGFERVAVFHVRDPHAAEEVIEYMRKVEPRPLFACPVCEDNTRVNEDGLCVRCGSDVEDRA